MPEQAREQEKMDKARRRFLTVWTAVGGILLAGVGIYLLNILSGPVGIVVWATIIVFCLRGPVNRLEKMGLSRLWATTISYVGMFVVLALVVLLLFSPAFGVGGQFPSLLESIPGYVQSVINWGNGFYSSHADIFQNDMVRQWLDDALSSLSTWASSVAKDSAAGVVAIGSAAVNSFMAIGFALVVAFWILMQLPELGRECQRLIGDKHREDANMLHLTLTRVMGGYIKGTLLQCAVIGIACGICFGIVGVPNYAALGGITGLLNILPIIGPWLGGALAAIVGIFVSPWVAIIALVATIIIQQFVYTFVSPRIMADSVDVHPALTLVALVAGSAIGGAMSGFTGSLVGMLVSIPAVAVMKSVFVYYFEKRTGRHLVSEDGVFFLGTPSSAEDIDPIADATSPHPGVAAAFERIEQRRAVAELKARQWKEERKAKDERRAKGARPAEGERSAGDGKPAEGERPAEDEREPEDDRTPPEP